MLGKVDTSAPPAPRTLYYEFCWNNVLNTAEKIAHVPNLKGALPVVYADGWTQAVRLGPGASVSCSSLRTTTNPLYNRLLTLIRCLYFGNDPATGPYRGVTLGKGAGNAFH